MAQVGFNRPLTLLRYTGTMFAPPLSVVPVFIALVLHLSGCAETLSQQAQCFADATASYRAAWRTAQAIRADLDRGYALHHEEVRIAQAVPCRVDGLRSSCLHDGRQTLALPVAIDRVVLANRLATLEAKMDVLRPAAMQAAAPCGYGDWAGPSAENRSR